MGTAVAEFVVADPPESWRRAGFTVDESSVCRVGQVGIRLGARQGESGIIGWALRGSPSLQRGDVDGIPTAVVDAPPDPPARHRNGASSVDHVVLFSHHLDRTVASLAALDIEPRRYRDAVLGGRQMRQVFFRLGEVIVEVVGTPDARSDRPSSLWGLTFVVEDIDATASFFVDRTAPVKDAVQPGRRITTLRHDALGMSVRTAFISAPILGA